MKKEDENAYQNTDGFNKEFQFFPCHEDMMEQ